MRRTRRRSKAPDDRQQGSGRKKAIGKRHDAERGSAQLKRVGSYVISMGAGLFADVIRVRTGMSMPKAAVYKYNGLIAQQNKTTIR